LKDSIHKLDKLLKVSQDNEIEVFRFEFQSLITFNTSTQSKSEYFLNLLKSASAATNIRSLAKEATEQMETSKLRLTSLGEYYRLSQEMLDPLLDIYVTRETILHDDIKKLRVELEEHKQKLMSIFEQFRALSPPASSTTKTT